MELLSITEVSIRYKKPRKTVYSAVQRKYLKSTQNQYKEHFIRKGDAEFYFNGPPFPSWWTFQQIASIGLPIVLLYTMKDRCDFRWILWKRNLYAYVIGDRGIEGHLKAMGFLSNKIPMIQMKRPHAE